MYILNMYAVHFEYVYFSKIYILFRIVSLGKYFDPKWMLRFNQDYDM